MKIISWQWYEVYRMAMAWIVFTITAFDMCTYAEVKDNKSIYSTSPYKSFFSFIEKCDIALGKVEMLLMRIYIREGVNRQCTATAKSIIAVPWKKSTTTTIF